MKPKDKGIERTQQLEFACNLAHQVGLDALNFWHEKGVSNLGTTRVRTY